MDPFEEFEFKPLTDGLGFHNKKASGAKSTKEEESISSKKFIKDQGLSLLDETTANPLSTPLPRKKTNISKNKPASVIDSDTGLEKVESSSSAVDDILKSLQKNRRFNFDEDNSISNTEASSQAHMGPATMKSKSSTVTARTGIQTTSYKSTFKTTTAAPAQVAAPIKEEFKETSLNFSSGLLDSMLIIAASILCMIILLIVTKADLIGNLTNPDEYGMIYIATAGMFAMVAFVYLTVNRVFIGQTPGEWAFDQRIGLPSDLNTRNFTVKVIGRSALIVLTGFIILPILSLIFKKDIAGQLTGAKIMRKV